MSYLLDTNLCIALLKAKEKKLVEKFRSRDPGEFFLSSVVKGELIYGARNSQRVDENLSVLKRFFPQFESLPFDDRAAEHYGFIRAVLKREGTPIGANDLLIAAIALAHDLVVLTRNREEFQRVPGLRWENW